tara:strand:+ start:90 stop:389 length:300 start_codon:yes stop_codon:yes gene_type:complete
MPIDLIKIVKSNKPNKKMMAVFLNVKTGRTKTIHFGSAGMSDYTINKDPERRKRYLDRHRKNENWNDYQTAGSLSRWILWGDTTSIQKNIKNYKSKFNL